MSFEHVVESLVNNSAQVIEQHKSDYIKDGLLHCYKCNTPKQARIQLFGEERTPYCLCKCETEKRDREEQERKKIEFLREVKANRKAGFPEADMQEWNFANDDMSNEKITKAMKNYVNNFPELLKGGKGLLLYGTVGTGKTYAACEVANALIDKGYPALVTNFARLTNTIQGMYEGKQEYIDSLNRYALLVIDDLGAERKSEFMQEMVFNIIDSRYRAGLPLIITTNLSIQEIKEPSDIGNNRIYDRILERCFPVEISGASRRRKAVRENYNDMKNLLGL